MNKRLIFILTVLLCWTTTAANAQWAVGIKGGWTYSSTSRTNLGRIDETYSAKSGYDIGLQAHYSFLDWLAIRADLSFMKRSHRMDRNLNYLDKVYTEYRNAYLMLPVMADFSFGGKKVRGHLLCGGFIGGWLQAKVKGTTYWMTDYYVYFNDFNEKRDFTSEDRRFTAGLVGGVSLNYDITELIGINIDALYYYDLVSYHKYSKHLKDPRYLNTLSVSGGIYFKF